jgi:ABC-type polysaccharide/polyol phosphate transport system ATPase subunit
MTTVISLKGASIKYKIEFKEEKRAVFEDIWVLKDFSADIKSGECVGIIGENGAGKTTLLRLVAGMLKPDKGSVEVKGRVSALMDIGAGFQKDATGKENIYLVSSLFGLDKKDIEKRYKEITDFAGLGRFINAPVKVYSQGMYMRLAFAIAIHVDPDILLVDDIFSVGTFMPSVNA